MGWRGLGPCTAAALACVLAVAATVRAQSNLSEHLAAKMTKVQDTDLQRRFGRALIDAGQDLQIDPAAGVDEACQALLRRASLYESVKEFDKAEASLTTALQMAPALAALNVVRGYFYIRRGRFADALGDFLAGVRIDPQDPRLRFAAGRAQAALGNLPAAIDFYGQAIRLGPREPSFYLARAEAQLRIDQPRNAIADYDRAIEMKLARTSDRYYAFVGRGFAELTLADYRGAVADFDSALDIDPRAVNALLWRGYAREMGGQADLALDDYERAAAVDPNDRWARANLQRLRSN
jgi:tetratricopeptide (TPR) repeat protein